MLLFVLKNMKRILPNGVSFKEGLNGRSKTADNRFTAAGRLFF